MSGLFAGRAFLPDRAIQFGFERAGEGYRYAAPMLGGELVFTCLVQAGEVSYTVSDGATGEEYILHRVESAAGEFVGQVRRARDELLSRIAASCFAPRAVWGEAGARALAFARERYGDSPQFLWKDAPEIAVLRRQDSDKWYAVFFRIPAAKLGLERAGDVPIVDVRIAKEQPIPQGAGYFPAYHMNKKSWLTLLLDGTLSDETVCARLEESYLLAAGKRGRRV